MVFFMTMGLEEHGYMLHKHSEDQVHEDSFEVHRLHNAEKKHLRRLLLSNVSEMLLFKHVSSSPSFRKALVISIRPINR